MKEPDSRQKLKWSDAVSYFMNEQMVNEVNESKLVQYLLWNIGYYVDGYLGGEVSHINIFLLLWSGAVGEVSKIENRSNDEWFYDSFFFLDSSFLTVDFSTKGYYCTLLGTCNYTLDDGI